MDLTYAVPCLFGLEGLVGDEVRRLGLAENTMDPLENEEVVQVLGAEQLAELTGLLRSTVPEDPVVEYDCTIRLDGAPKAAHITCRAMWSLDTPAQYIGAIGEIIELEGGEEVH